MLCVDLPKGEQRKFLRSTKTSLDVTWQDLAKSLNVSRSMVYFYANKHSRIPFDKYKLLCELRGVSLPIIPTVVVCNSLKPINTPPLCPELAEFLGIVSGDGHVNGLTYEVSIALDKIKDREYAKHVADMFERLFFITPSWIETSNLIRIKVYSKHLAYFLSSCGMPFNRKMNRLRLPESVKKEHTLLISYLRGLFDTDGSIHKHHNSNAAVEFISRDMQFLEDILQALDSLKFRTSHHGKNIFIYPSQDIHRFFQEIKPANPKHLRRYASFCPPKIAPDVTFI